jgi:hypothetical protein
MVTLCLKSISKRAYNASAKVLDEIRPMDEIGNLDSLQKVDAKEPSLVENLK